MVGGCFSGQLCCACVLSYASTWKNSDLRNVRAKELKAADKSSESSKTHKAGRKTIIKRLKASSVQ